MENKKSMSITILKQKDGAMNSPRRIRLIRPVQEIQKIKEDQYGLPIWVYNQLDLSKEGSIQFVPLEQTSSSLLVQLIRASVELKNIYAKDLLVYIEDKYILRQVDRAEQYMINPTEISNEMLTQTIQKFEGELR